MSQQGGSLIEILIILTIWGILSSSILYIHPKLQNRIHLHLFSHQILTDLHRLKLRATYTGQNQQAHLHENHIRYLDSSIIRKCPETIQIKKGTTQKIGFKPNGNTQFPGTITLQSGRQKKEISVSVGPGRIHRK